MEQHQATVQRIAESVKIFYEQQRPFRIYHGSTNSTRKCNRDLATSIDVSALSNILYIDETRQVASVEPNVPMDALVKTTLACGLVPPVVPEAPPPKMLPVAG